MKRLFPATLFALVPTIAFAALLTSTGDVMSSVLSEKRPVAFTISTSHHGGAVTTVSVKGQREGAGPEKAWQAITLRWQGGSEWMHVEADLRLNAGKAYFRIASAEGSAGADLLPSLRGMAGQWMMLHANDPAVRAWFAPDFLQHDLASAVRITGERFKSGYTYSFEPLSAQSAESFRLGVASAVPWLLAPKSSASMNAKVDTNLSNDFQYAMLSFGSTFEFKAQRQFHAVYVETPKSAPMMQEGPVYDLFFQRSAMMTSDVVPNSDSRTMPEPAATKIDAPVSRTMSSVARRERRLAPRAVLDLHGADAANLKISVLITSGPLEWDSAAAFETDFSAGRGILYHYPSPTVVRFSAKGAYAGLEVIFFDQAGRYISSASMPRCESLNCPVYLPEKPATFALEISTGFIDRTKISKLWRLSLDWVSDIVPGENSQAIDRTAVRVIENRLRIPTPQGWRTFENSGGDQSLRILAEVTAAKLRIADIAAGSSVRRNQDALYRLNATLIDTLHANKLPYAFIVVPTQAEDTYALVLDTLTYASIDILDTNKNGKIDTWEKPAPAGMLFHYVPFTNALSSPIFDSSPAGEIAVYVPVKDANGTTVAVLALVK